MIEEILQRSQWQMSTLVTFHHIYPKRVPYTQNDPSINAGCD